MRWIEGPDRVRAQVNNRTMSTSGYFLNITPEDIAIEVDRVALIKLDKAALEKTGERGIQEKEGLPGVISKQIFGLYQTLFSP